jgi:uncharacterized membrane protein
MSDLVAIAYIDEATARRARANLAEDVGKGLIEVEDVLILSHEEDGRISPVLSGSEEAGFDAAGRTVAGGLIGLTLLGPLLSMAVGAETRSSGSFVYELRDSLAPGNAALVVLVRDLTPQQLLPHLHEPGHVVHVSLPDEVEVQLDAARGSGGK